MVKVSANLTRWQILGVHLESIQLRCTSRHQEHLHFLRRSHLRREPLVALGRSSESQHQRGCNRDEKKQLNRVAGMDGNRVVLEEDCGSRRTPKASSSPGKRQLDAVDDDERSQQRLGGKQQPRLQVAPHRRSHQPHQNQHGHNRSADRRNRLAQGQGEQLIKRGAPHYPLSKCKNRSAKKQAIGLRVNELPDEEELSNLGKRVHQTRISFKEGDAARPP